MDGPGTVRVTPVQHITGNYYNNGECDVLLSLQINCTCVIDFRFPVSSENGAGDPLKCGHWGVDSG